MAISVDPDEPFHVVIGGQVTLLSLEGLDQAYQDDRITEETLIWQEGLGAWLPLARVLAELGADESEDEAQGPAVPQDEKLAEDEYSVSFGPNDVRKLSLDQLDDFYRLDVVTDSTLVWQPGFTEWLPLSALLGGEEEPEHVSLAPPSVAPAAQSSRGQYSLGPSGQGPSGPSGQVLPGKSARARANAVPPPSRTASVPPPARAVPSGAAAGRTSAVPAPSLPPPSVPPPSVRPSAGPSGAGSAFPQEMSRPASVPAPSLPPTSQPPTSSPFPASISQAPAMSTSPFPATLSQPAASSPFPAGLTPSRAPASGLSTAPVAFSSAPLRAPTPQTKASPWFGRGLVAAAAVCALVVTQRNGLAQSAAEQVGGSQAWQGVEASIGGASLATPHGLSAWLAEIEETYGLDDLPETEGYTEAKKKKFLLELPSDSDEGSSTDSQDSSSEAAAADRASSAGSDKGAIASKMQQRLQGKKATPVAPVRRSAPPVRRPAPKAKSKSSALEAYDPMNGTL